MNWGWITDGRARPLYSTARCLCLVPPGDDRCAAELGHIEAIDPDTFIINQWDLDPVNAMAAFKRMRARRKKPLSSPEDFAYALEVGGLPTTAERLRAAAELI